ncbi:MAG: twin-arginine translocase subunit TatC [Ancrocorticia sp.]|uniref:twin-arginine translocase subunit TatC n=1 Tax=Ancrocorticia sp. TaxID=2593684 RepID=UPI003F91465B
MSVAGHLKELRKRLLLALLGIMVGAIGGWALYEQIMDFITGPLLEMEDANTVINFPTIGSGLDLKLRVALWAGTLLASPWWIYQIGAFIMPGLKRREKLYTVVFGAVGVLLFAAGAASGLMMIPRAVEILQSFVPTEAFSVLQADTYVDFYLRLVILFGVSFLLPEILVALNFLGVLSSKAMLRGWRWAVLVAFTFAAIANPLPSPWPMIVQAMVLVVLYLLAVLISWIRERYKLYGRRLRPAKHADEVPSPPVPSNSVPSPHPASAPASAVGPVPTGNTYTAPVPAPAPSTPKAPSGGDSVPGMSAAPAPASAASPAQTDSSYTAPTPGMGAAPAMGPDSFTDPVPSIDPAHVAAVIILAGGTAKRMGGVSKPDVVVGGQRLLDRALAEVGAAVPGAPIVVVAPQSVSVPKGVIRVLEYPPLGGPMAGISAALGAIRSLQTYRPDGFIALLTCDAPLAPRLYPKLIEAAIAPQQDSGQLVAGAIPEFVGADGNRHSQFLHGVFRGGALEQLTAGDVRDTSVRAVFGQLRLNRVDDADRVGMDVDTWDDAKALEQRLSSEHSTDKNVGIEHNTP